MNKIIFGENVFDRLNKTIAKNSYSKVFVLLDENTKRHCLPILKKYLTEFITIKIKSGEGNKNIDTATFIWETLHKNFADRQSVLINLGGGALSDIGGFCASTFLRGIDFINVPSTLLSMVDASIGAKQGLNLRNYKNVIGVFNHPKCIFVYPDFIKTLAESELKNGLAEIVKHALIADKKLWNKIYKIKKFDTDNLSKLILSSIRIKSKITTKDPHEFGLRKVLNYGHTIAHAIETFSMNNDGNNFLKHGEAVAIGIVCESYISHKINKFPLIDLNLIVSFIKKHFKKYHCRWDEILLIKNMSHDKKNNSRKINFTLLNSIGDPIVNCNCTDELICESLNYYKNAF